MIYNTAAIDFLTKCRFNMGHFNCFSFDKFLLAIGFAGILFIILGTIAKLAKNHDKKEEGSTHN